MLGDQRAFEIYSLTYVGNGCTRRPWGSLGSHAGSEGQSRGSLGSGGGSAPSCHNRHCLVPPSHIITVDDEDNRATKSVVWADFIDFVRCTAHKCSGDTNIESCPIFLSDPRPIIGYPCQ